ncbi:MAG: protein translocase subunit SecD, partial [Actinobacteria bacterium]|nr:protein translocase subunit SecD [Actinomycetota bacterium]
MAPGGSELERGEPPTVAPPAGRVSPWRNLAIFAGIVAVLYSLVFFTGNADPTPKLGIDLQGGTRVTLTARTIDGKAPPKESLDQARQIIEERVNGIGVTGAEVVLDGTNLIITVPGENGDQARTLGQTAKLYFRTVITQQAAAPPPPTPGTPGPGGGQDAPPGTSGQSPVPEGAPTPVAPQRAQPPPGEPTPAPSPGTAPPPVGEVPEDSADPKVAEQIRQARAVLQSQDPSVQQQALARLNCAVPNPLRGNDDPSLPLVTCDQDNKVKYVLGPAFMSGERVTNASAGPSKQGAGFEVNLDFDRPGED